MSIHEENSLLRLRALRFLYLLVFIFSICFLFLSRSGEAYTVWGVLHPAFIPIFSATTFFLLLIVFSAEKTEYKLLFTILHSILSHSFFVIVFPAGNVGIQQSYLGATRLVFDNIISHGFGWTLESIPLKIYILFRGENLQAAFSVIFARMFGVDVYWSHLILVPLLWGIFVPVATFVTTKTLGASEKISALASLMTSLFPANIIWGAASISNSLGYLFFFCFVYFLLKYINSNRAKDLFLVVAFFSISFLSHYLAGTVAFSFLILANSVRTYHKERTSSPLSARSMLLLGFIFCASILPFALAYRRLFYPTANTHFSLQKLYERPITDVLLSLLLGSYFDLISRGAYITTIIFGVAPLIGFIGMTCIILRSVRRTSVRSIDPSLLFLCLGLLIVVVDDRILKHIMVNVPFFELERLWLFRDFVLVPFLAIFIGGAIDKMRTIPYKLSKDIPVFSRKFSARRFWKKFSLLTHIPRHKAVHLASTLTYVALLAIVSSWVTASVYYAYPRWAPLQTTSYELEAVKYIEATTNETYIVICDLWMTYAGVMIVGTNNPQAYYFSSGDPHGVALFIEMKKNPTNETMKEAMKTNNATTAYFIIEKPRLGVEEYSRIKSQAMQNDLKTLPLPKRISHYRDEEKLCIFYYKEQSAKVNE